MKMKWKRIVENEVITALVSSKGYRIDKILHVKDKARRYVVQKPMLTNQEEGFVKLIGYAGSSADAVDMCDKHYKDWLSGSGRGNNSNNRLRMGT